MAKKGKKTAGIPNEFLIVGLVGVAAVVGYVVYRKKSVRQAQRARALRSIMLGRRGVSGRRRRSLAAPAVIPPKYAYGYSRSNEEALANASLRSILLRGA